MVKICTSILTAKQENAIQTFYDLEVAKTDYFHIDVMDGKFVEKNTQDLMLEYATTIKHISNIPLDVHLMVENIKENIDKYVALEPDIITFHYEACKDDDEVNELIKYIKESGVKCGISIKPNTSVDKIYKFLPYIYMCLIMTVEPGKGGQKLIPETIEKIKQLKKYIDENNLDTLIQADGGINTQTIDEVKSAGTEMIVAGSAIVDSENMKEAIRKLKI